MFHPLEPYNELPPISALFLDTVPLAKLAEKTHVAIEVLRYAAKSLPEPVILLDTLAFQEARASSNVENIITTNNDLYHGVVFSDYTPEAQKVAAYKNALMDGFQRIGSNRMLSLTDIEDINHYLNPISPGFRNNLPQFGSLTRISKIKTDGTRDIIYTPPHGKERIQELLIDTLDYLYDDETFDVHPLIKIALAHYQFECIHPFRDGNGRTGRILNLLFLCQKGYLDAPILFASSYITQHKGTYYSLLHITKETEDYAPFVEFMLCSFLETAQKTLNIVEQIKALLESYTDPRFLSQLKGQYLPLKGTVEIAFRKVYIRNIDLVNSSLGLHRQTAAVYLDQLAETGLLRKEKVGRDNIYKNIKLLSLFDDAKEE